MATEHDVREEIDESSAVEETATSSNEHGGASRARAHETARYPGGEADTQLEVDLDDVDRRLIDKARRIAAAKHTVAPLSEDAADDESDEEEWNDESDEKEWNDEPSLGHEQDAGADATTAPFTPASLVVAGAAALAAFAAGALVTKPAAGAFAVGALAVVLTVIPGYFLVRAARAWLERLRREQRQVVESAAALFQGVFEGAVERGERLQANAVRASAEIDATIKAELARREEEAEAKTRMDIEKVRVFFESLLEKHVYRINRELRETEEKLEALEAERAAASTVSEEACKLTDEVESLRDHIEKLEAEADVLRRELEAEHERRDAEAAKADEDESGAGDREADVEQLTRNVSALEDEVRGLRETVERNREYLGCFDRISTQLKNHLQIARKLVDKVTRGDGDSEKHVDEIDTHLLSLERLVKQMVDLEKVEMADWKLVYSEVCVKDLLRRVTDDFRETAREKGVKIHTRVPKEMASQLLDQTLVARALKELVGNAVAYTDQGGHVTVSASLQPADENDENDETGRDAIVIKVKDTGKGVAQKDQTRIFEPFEQGKRPRFSLVGAGVGLGLPLACGYIRQLGGAIALESETGYGSTFTVMVPVKELK